MSADERSEARIVIIDTQSQAVVDAVLRELGRAERCQRVYIERIKVMGDMNSIAGQAAAVGSHAGSEASIFIHASSLDIANIDLDQLAEQLGIVRSAMKNQRGLSLTVEQDDEIGQVAGAQIAARKGDREGVIAHLKKVGRWTLDVAKETGAEIVALTLAHLAKG
jgi:hypothetical protein